MNKSLATVGYVTQIVLFLSLLLAGIAVFVAETVNPTHYPERGEIAALGLVVGMLSWVFISYIFNDLKSLFELHLAEALSNLVNRFWPKINTPTGKKIVVGLLIVVYTPFLWAIITNWNIAAPFVIALAVVVLVGMLVTICLVSVYLKMWEKYHVIFDDQIPDELREDYGFEARIYSRMIRNRLRVKSIGFPTSVYITPDQIHYTYPAAADYFGHDPAVEMNLALTLQREVKIERLENSDVLTVKRVQHAG